jgi:hypothetical protein
MAITVSETWEQFTYNCACTATVVPGERKPCTHKNGIGHCLEKKYCPRLKHVAAKVDPEWYKDIVVYYKDHDVAAGELWKDKEWISKWTEEHPGYNFYSSFQKARLYWRSVKGWERKRKQKVRVINWRTTYQNALDMEFNWVKEKAEKLI